MIAEPRRRTMSAEEFEAFTFLPENADRVFELIAGAPVEVPSILFSSSIGIRIAARIMAGLQRALWPLSIPMI